jgi:hypothetical protein
MHSTWSSSIGKFKKKQPYRPWPNPVWQFFIKWLLWTVGTFYIMIERLRNYPNEERDNILGMPIDKDLQDLSRFDLCAYMDQGMPKPGFWDLNSTTKIRLGAQMMRNLKLTK